MRQLLCLVAAPFTVVGMLLYLASMAVMFCSSLFSNFAVSILDSCGKKS